MGSVLMYEDRTSGSTSEKDALAVLRRAMQLGRNLWRAVPRCVGGIKL